MVEEFDPHPEEAEVEGSAHHLAAVEEEGFGPHPAAVEEAEGSGPHPAAVEEVAEGSGPHPAVEEHPGVAQRRALAQTHLARDARTGFADLVIQGLESRYYSFIMVEIRLSLGNIKLVMQPTIDF